ALIEGHRDLDGLHWIAHGSEAGMALSDTLLSVQTLEKEPELIAAIEGALGADADLMLYGCDLGQGELPQTLARLTGADVASSLGLTGDGGGADYVLERHDGEIETASLDLEGAGLLLSATASASEALADLITGTTERDAFIAGLSAPFQAGGHLEDFAIADASTGTWTYTDGTTVTGFEPLDLLASRDIDGLLGLAASATWNVARTALAAQASNAIATGTTAPTTRGDWVTALDDLTLGAKQSLLQGFASELGRMGVANSDYTTELSSLLGAGGITSGLSSDATTRASQLEALTGRVGSLFSSSQMTLSYDNSDQPSMSWQLKLDGRYSAAPAAAVPADYSVLGLDALAGLATQQSGELSVSASLPMGLATATSGDAHYALQTQYTAATGAEHVVFDKAGLAIDPALEVDGVRLFSSASSGGNSAWFAKLPLIFADADLAAANLTQLGTSDLGSRFNGDYLIGASSSTNAPTFSFDANQIIGTTAAITEARSYLDSAWLKNSENGNTPHLTLAERAMPSAHPVGDAGMSLLGLLRAQLDVAEPYNTTTFAKASVIAGASADQIPDHQLPLLRVGAVAALDDTDTTSGLRTLPELAGIGRGDGPLARALGDLNDRIAQLWTDGDTLDSTAMAALATAASLSDSELSGVGLGDFDSDLTAWASPAASLTLAYGGSTLSLDMTEVQV
ncbi:MAG: DUF4347 domain-containing protein, partial [Litorivicinus sp.]